MHGNPSTLIRILVSREVRLKSVVVLLMLLLLLLLMLMLLLLL
jgi:hypothetical protein